MLDEHVKKVGPYSYFVARVIVGLLFAIHGAQKFGLIGDGNIAGFASAFGFPLALGIFVASIELLGGLAIAFGFLTRIATFFGSAVMITAYFMAHLPNGWLPTTNGGELSLLFLSAFLIFFARGAGIWSVDKLLCKNCHSHNTHNKH